MNDLGEVRHCRGVDERTLARAEQRALDVEGCVILATLCWTDLALDMSPGPIE